MKQKSRSESIKAFIIREINTHNHSDAQVIDGLMKVFEVTEEQAILVIREIRS
jgi:hypothetical protein